MQSGVYQLDLPARAFPLLQRLRGKPPLLLLVCADLHDGAQLTKNVAARLNLPCQEASLQGADAVQTQLDVLESAWQGVLVVRGGQTMLGCRESVQALVERLPSWEAEGQILVLIATSPEHPQELARDLVVLRLALPSPEELLPLVTAALGRCQDPRTHEAPMIQAAVRAVQGLTLAQARRALRALGADATPAAILAQLAQEKRLLLGALEVLEVIDKLPRLSDIGGLDALKSWLSRARAALEPEARAFGLPPPKGVLLVGVQGCGKSLTAKASAAVLGLPLVRLDIGRLFTARHTPEENLRTALDAVSALAPVVLWVDELDKAFAGAASGGSEAAGRVLGSLLTWMGDQRGVFVAATANRVQHLPAELLRKGRFDETFFVDIPDQQSRHEILALSLRRSGRDPAGYDVAALALAADRLTGAELEQAVLEALAVAYSERRDLRTADISSALSNAVPFVETYDEQVRDLRVWARRHCRPAGRDRTLHELFASAHDLPR